MQNHSPNIRNIGKSALLMKRIVMLNLKDMRLSFEERENMPNAIQVG